MAYATPAEIVAQWRPLTPEQTARSTALLDMAAIMLRRHVVLDNLPLGDEKLTIAKQVSIEMVIDALIPGDHRGKSAYAFTVGSIVESATLLNGTATLVFTTAQRDLFGLSLGAEPRYKFGD
ncbi:hypothetical protein [Rhodococcus sp. ARP2]|uniref:hypothetical protein n=1 Tax=Rhodococcus sp. ARP2 TaxID=1661385 RepID=UPI00064BB354|nr:hypothetical protein [Rhodococcus sp. ARP2]